MASTPELRPPCVLVVMLLLIGRLSSASASFCTAPLLEDYSHRRESGKVWLLHRTRQRSIGNWGTRSWSSWKMLKSSLQNVTQESLEQFVRWSNKKSGADPGNFFVRPVETPWCPSEGAHDDSVCMLSSFAAQAVEEGETIVEFPLESCLSDVLRGEDPKSLEEAPWEVRLATKLLRERARGKASPWAPFIQVLPTYVQLPLFFSNLELNNLEDGVVVEEVQSMRKFAQSSYQVLRDDETSGAKFNEFVWALSVIYRSACKTETRDGTSVHLVLPYISSGVPGAVYAEQVSGRVILRAKQNVEKGMPLSLNLASRSTTIEFVYNGNILQKHPGDGVHLFGDLMELVDWYLATYSSVNNNKYLTLVLIRDVVETVTSHLSRRNRTVYPQKVDFSLGSDGYVNPHMLCIFAALCYVKDSLDPNNENNHRWDQVTVGDLETKEGPWESKMSVLAEECLNLSGKIARGCQNLGSADTRLSKALMFAMAAVQRRVEFLLDSYPTDMEEDRLLLAAAAWEGYASAGRFQACPTCRWQIEQLSQNDYLAVKFRSAKKSLLLDIASRLSCGSSVSLHNDLKPVTRVVQSSHQDPQEFLDWCEKHEFFISKKLSILDINVKGKGEGITDEDERVRGVVVVENFTQGDTLSSLPLHMGLFDKESMHVPDGWDHASARLLRERALGNSSRWAPYITILPSKVPTPINLESTELKEVQWWPLLRELVQVRKSIKESFSLLADEAIGWATLEDFRWAATIVHSRAFTLPVTDDEEYAPYVLMPFMDMINHHYHYQADWISEPVWNGKLDIIAKRSLRKGEQLFASFGPRTNDNLFLYYGFVLEDNPWDTAQIFPCFEESVRWFLQLWSRRIGQLQLMSQKQRWALVWPKVREALDDVAGGGRGQNKEWVQLINHWADFGFQFLPYDPSPTIYARGIIDPSLLAAMATVAEYTFPGTGFPENHGMDISVALNSYFACLRRNAPTDTLAEWADCTDSMGRTFYAKDQAERSKLIAEVSIATRCFQVLQSFPTTIEEDMQLLEDDSSWEMGQNPNSKLLQLTVRYRYMKKLVLQAVIDRLLRSVV